MSLIPSAAHAEELPGTPTTHSTFGYIATDADGNALETDIEAQIQQADSFERSEASAADTPADSRPSESAPQEHLAATAADPAYSIVSTWTDSNAKTTVARRGNGTTWGLTKVQNFHNVNLNMVKKTTKFPRPVEGRYTQGNAIIYRTDAIEWECWLGVCNPKRSMIVRVVVENTRLGDGSQKGLITAYCEGVVSCPQWVVNVAG